MTRHEHEPEHPARGNRELELIRNPASIEQEVARRTVRVGALLVAVVAFLYALLYGVGGTPEFVLPCLATAALLAAIALVPFGSELHRLHLAVVAGMGLLTAQTLMVGRVDTGIMVWFLVPVLATMIVGAKQLAAIGATYAAALIVVTVLAKRLGWPIVGDVPLANADLVMAAAMVGTISVFGAIAWISLRARLQLVRGLTARNADLAEALDTADAARAAAENAAEAKDRFFANLTHEIRTPLNGIAGTTELLRGTRLDDDQRTLTDALLDSTQNLVVLVNAMLDHARLRAGHVELDLGRLEVRRAARDIDRLYGAQAAAKGLELRVEVSDDVPAWVETDGIRLRQIVGNLVANAIKFTAHGWIRVTGTIAQPDATHPSPRLVVAVADTGAGIRPELAREIFEPFVQGDPSISRQHGGTGLGLAIANQLAGLMGGTLAVRSELGGGSVFTLAVPVRVLPAPDPAPDPAVVRPLARPAPGGAQLHVVVAEDNEINRTLAVRMLERLGTRVSLASNGHDAVELAACLARAGDGPDLVLMDLQMPVLDGITAAAMIRAREAAEGAPRVPIVAMTGNDPGDYGEACVAVGMDDFLMKPVSLAQLHALLERTTAARGTPA
jgi:signal transduction histidine kinase